MFACSFRRMFILANQTLRCKTQMPDGIKSTGRLVIVHGKYTLLWTRAPSTLKNVTINCLDALKVISIQ